MLRGCKCRLLLFCLPGCLTALGTTRVVFDMLFDCHSYLQTGHRHSALPWLPTTVCSGVLAFLSLFQNLATVGAIEASELCMHSFRFTV